MESIRRIEKRYCSVAMTAAIIIAFLFIIAGWKPMAKGLVLGTLFSVLNFILIGETLPARLGRTRMKTMFLSLGSMLFRYLLLAVPIAAAFRFKEFDLASTGIGIFFIQIVIIADHLYGLISPKHSERL